MPPAQPDPGSSGPPPSGGQKDYGRAGRNIPVSIASAVVLLGLAAGSLLIIKSLFMLLVAIVLVAGVWELRRGLLAKEIDLPEQPLMIGGVVMMAAAYFWGAPALVTATAVSALAIMLWLLHRGVDGYVRTATASVFTLIYLPFLGSFVGLMLSEGGRRWHVGVGIHDNGVKGIIAFVLVTIASDIGGFVAGVLFGKHPMARVISPKKSWEGFAGSAILSIAVGVGLVMWMWSGQWYVGVALGAIAVVMAVLGDLVESVIKRDLGVKDMSHIIPGHGGIMDRLDSLLATIAPVWLLLHHFIF